MEQFGVTFLIDHYQDILYEVRDHCRRAILAGEDSGNVIAQWMQTHYAEQLASDGYDLTQDEWLDLADSCLEDTQEVMEYEAANGLPVEP